MKTIDLLDNYEANGTDLDEFIEETKALDEATEYIKVAKNNLEILSYEAPLPDDMGYRVLKLNKETISQFEELGEHSLKKHIRISAPGPSPELDDFGHTAQQALRCIIFGEHNACKQNQYEPLSTGHKINSPGCVPGKAACIQQR